MADLKISELTNLTAADPVSDMLPIVDVSATPPASGSTKRISINNLLSSSPTASGALTVTGLVTAGSATITGAATVGTTLGVTGASNLSGQLTVSTGANATPLNLTCSNAAGTTFNLANTGGAGTHSFGGYNALIGGGNTTDLCINSAGQTIIRAGSTNVATFATAGNLTVGTGNVVIGTAAKGIDFTTSADGSGTVTAELLNDYEEGTWSPTPSGNVNLTSVVSVSARYTKVGRLVTLSGQVTATVTSPNIVTYFVLPSLPFANGTVTTGAVQENGNLTVGAIQVSASNLYGFFPAASAVVSGAATFNYSVTYSV